MNPTDERAGLEIVFRDTARPVVERVLAGDALRYSLAKDKQPADAIAAEVIALGLTCATDHQVYDALERAYITRAPNNFHDYLIALEWKRPAKTRFYQPRMKVLRPVVDALTDMMVNDLYDIVMLSTPPRAGKAQPLTAKVLTPTGFTTMGELRVGTEVMSGTGNVTRVTDIFPQGEKDVYRVTFKDGAATECCADHLWKVQTRDDRKNRVHRVMPLKDMLHNLKVENGKRFNYSIDYIDPIPFTERELHLHPYVMGALLGDGSLTNGNCCIVNADAELLARFSDLLPPTDTLATPHKYTYRIIKRDMITRTSRGFMVRSGTQNALYEYGLIGCGSKTKFIPRDYLYASIEQRWELLRGLLDTDGYAGHGGIEYVTVSPKLRDDVIELVHSLGGYASVASKIGHYVKDGHRHYCSRAYRVNIQFDSSAENPFFLGRKVRNPKRSVLKRFITSVELVRRADCQCIVVDDPSHLYITDDYIITHNTTTGLFFNSWLAGRNPDEPILMTGYAEKITKMFHDGLTEVYDDPMYNYHAIFPQLALVDTSAKDLTLDFRDDGKSGTRKYKTITCRAIDGSLTGATEARQLLYCDDLVRDIEEAMSLGRLQMLRDKMVTNVYSRKKEGCKELHIGTRWSIHDPLGWVERMHEDDPRCKVIRIPALDPDTGESNFDYPYGVGFSTAYYQELKRLEDEVTWQCVYQQQPIERAGLLFPSDDLTFVYEIPDLKEHPPDDIFAFCDVAFGGEDYLALPIAYQWGNEPPIIADAVFIKGGYKTTEPMVAGALVQRNVQRVVFEANNGGDFYSRDVHDLVAATGHKCQVTAVRAASNKSKETRIVQHSPAIKTFSFMHPSVATPMYRAFLTGLTTYTMSGKNEHDDAPDSLAGLAAMMRTNLNATLTVYDRKHI